MGWTSTHRSAWFNKARKMAWIWLIVAGSRPADTTHSQVPGVRSRIVPVRTIPSRQICG